MQLDGLLSVRFLNLNLGRSGLDAEGIVVFGVDHHCMRLSEVMSVSEVGVGEWTRVRRVVVFGCCGFVIARLEKVGISDMTCTSFLHSWFKAAIYYCM